MSISQNTVSQIGDVLQINVNTPILGIIMLSSFLDDTEGETGSRYFEKTFRYSVDGINFSEWKTLSNENVASIRVEPTSAFKVEYKYRRTGSDPSGLLQFNEVSVSGQYTNLEEPSIYSRSIFSQFFSFYDIEVLNWSLNVLEKLYKGIVPKYIERGQNENENLEDEDFLKFWKSITHYFAIFVKYVRLFEHIESNKTILLQYLKSHDLYVNDDIDITEAIYLMNNLFDEIRQRGIIQIASSKDEEIDESSSSLLIDRYIKQVDGELLRLIGKGALNEFIFCPVEPWKVGLYIDQNSPLYRGVDFYNANKSYEKSEGFVEISKYPTINSQYFELTNEEGKNGVLKISNVSQGSISGIGLEGYIIEDPVVYYNEEKSQEFTRDNCGSGYTGSTVNYIVYAGTYSSLTSQEAANNKALQDIADNGQNYANSYGVCNIDYILEEEFEDWFDGLPLGWENDFAYKPIRGTVTPDSGRARIGYTGTTNQNMIIAKRNLIPIGKTSINVTIKVDEITPGGGSCAYTFLEILTVNDLDIVNGNGESKAMVGLTSQFLKTPGIYTFSFNTSGYRNFVLKYRNVDGLSHVHTPPVTCVIDYVKIW